MARAARPRREVRAMPVLPLRDLVQLPGAVNTVLIVRPQSRRAVEAAVEGSRHVFAVTELEAGGSENSELGATGTISEVLQWSPLPNGAARLVLKGVNPARTSRIQEESGAIWADVKTTLPDAGDTAEMRALCEEVRESFSRVAISERLPDESVEAGLAHENPSDLCYAIAHLAPASLREKQELLNEPDLRARLSLLFTWLRRQELVSSSRQSIRAATDARLAESQRDFLLRQQLKTIQSELGSLSRREGDELRARLAEKKFSDAIAAFIERQITSWETLAPDSAEAAVAIKHIETVLSLPSKNSEAMEPDLKRAKELLDDAHYGLDAVKQRVLEYLAVRKLTRAHNSPPLCFVGPPGVGKTSFAKSVAQCLGRPATTVSLGGVRDEADIRGHRRTYVGAQPGRIVQALIRAGVSDPVCILDEIDKVSFEGARSDPAAALLELLDRSQSTTFHDHFIDFPLDVSNALFIATANSLDALPAALLDRLEVVEFHSYTQRERLAIAKRFLLPAARYEHGLNDDNLILDDALLEKLAAACRETGVRGLNRMICAVCRQAALKLSMGGAESITLNQQVISALLQGAESHTVSTEPAIGVANALVVASYGGDAIRIECVTMQPIGSVPELRLTGSMGEVMRESAETALSVLRCSSFAGLSPEAFQRDIHIHATQADRAKEGPSAGVSILLALASALTSRTLPASFAATGELTLTGSIMPVGGVREKLAAAQRHEMKRVLIPEANMPELASLPRDLLEGIEIVGVTCADEALGYLSNR